jgi:hypothetical protein
MFHFTVVPSSDDETAKSYHALFGLAESAVRSARQQQQTAIRELERIHAAMLEAEHRVTVAEERAAAAAARADGLERNAIDLIEHTGDMETMMDSVGTSLDKSSRLIQTIQEAVLTLRGEIASTQMRQTNAVCCICREADITHAYTACGHTVCGVCLAAGAFDRCPVCRQENQAPLLRIYLNN